MTGLHYTGAIFILITIILVGFFAGKKIKSSNDFESAGKKASSGMVVGALVGTLVGGASTIGTSQLAFSYGFSAWWFTLGGGIALIVLGKFYINPLFMSNTITIPQLISNEYGKKAGVLLALLSSIGSFMSIVSQVLSGMALIGALSNISHTFSMLVVVSLMLAYVLYGGALGVSYVGFAKSILLSFAIGYCGYLAIRLSGGLSSVFNSTLLPKDVFFNPFSRGITVDLGAALSMVLGVLTTQAYISAVLSAKTVKISKRGIYLSAVLVPLIGIAGIFVGLFMRISNPDISAQYALPLFIMDYLPAIMAGGILAILLIAVVGTGAGLALSVSTILVNDLYVVIKKEALADNKRVLITRLFIFLILLSAGLTGMSNLGGLILSWSFLSMGLRGAASIGVFNAALFLKGKIKPVYAILSMILGVVFTIGSKFLLPQTIDPVIAGISVSLICILIGYANFLKQGNNILD